MSKIPQKIADEIIYKSDRKCCVCDSEGEQIHHIDENNENHVPDNLILLCINCHVKTTEKSNMKRNTLTAGVLKQYRQEKYEVIENNRKNLRKIIDNQFNNFQLNNYFEITKTAIIIIEIAKIKEEYCNFSDRKVETLEKLFKFSEHSNNRIAFEVFNFLTIVSGYARAGITEDTVLTIHSLILSFFNISAEEEKETINENGKICIEIGYNLVYDSLIYLKDLRIAEFGLSIIKYIYRTSKQAKYEVLKQEVQEIYKEIRRSLDRPERNDLENGKELVEIFYKDLEENDLSFPNLPDYLLKLTKKQK